MISLRKRVIKFMFCTLHGVLVEAGVKDMKDNQTGVVNSRPYIAVYSEGSTQIIYGMRADGKKIGDQIDVKVSMKLREWDGRKYLSVRPIE